MERRRRAPSALEAGPGGRPTVSSRCSPPPSFDRVVSSPFVRCRETVEPLAAAAGLEVELDDRLAEGAGPYGALGLVREVAPKGGVLCSHGDVITELLALLERAGIDLGDDPRCEKGSVWVLELEGEQVVSAPYLPPPS